MSGNQCSDIGGISVQTPQGSDPLCVMPENHPYAGVVTYRDGRVVTLDPKNPGTGNFDVARTNELSGAELGDCAARDNSKSLSFLQTTYKGSSVSWGAKELKEVYRILGQAEGQTGNAFFCSNREDRTRVALNNDIAHLPSLRAAIETLQKNHGGLDDLHYNALLESLRTAAGVPAPADHTSDLVGVGIVFTIVGLATGIIGFVAKAVWDKISKGPKDGGGPKPPSGGGGGGGRMTNDLPVIPVNQVPAGAEVQWPSGHVVKDGQVIGQAGGVRRDVSEEGVFSGAAGENIGNDTIVTPLPDFVHNWDEEPTREWVALPEGVVTPDEGALIYDPQYHAWIDGKIVALPPESGFESLAGGNYTMDQFLSLVRGGGHTSDETVRSLNLKGPKAIAVNGAVRLSTADEAAAGAADRMRTGAQGGHVNGFGAQGAGAIVEVPVVRVQPAAVMP